MELKVDETFKSLIPPLTSAELAQLEESLRMEGCRDPLVVWNDTIVDGHNRYEICQKHNITFKTYPMEFQYKKDAETWILKNQLGRRNLTDFSRVNVGLKLKPYLEEQAQRRKKSGKSDLGTKSRQGRVAYQVAETVGVSENTVRKVEKINEEAPKDVKEQLVSGEISINKAYQELPSMQKKKKQLTKKEKEMRKRMKIANKTVEEANTNPKCMHQQTKVIELCEGCGEILRTLKKGVEYV